MKFADEAELTQWARKAPFLWVFLDYDGTLVDFSPSPEQLIPQPGVISVIQRLARKPNIRVTIISGRRLPDLQTLLPVEGISLAGTYGIDILTPEGQHLKRVTEDDIHPTLESLKSLWEQIISGRNGFILEDKGMALALHARFADDAEIAWIFSDARRIYHEMPVNANLHLYIGDKFLEVAPIMASKKDSVFFMLQQFPFPGAWLLYLGDDDKDEQAFNAIHGSGGAAVKVLHPPNLPQTSRADYFFESPAQTIQWLNTLIA